MEDDNRLNLSLSLPNDGQSASFKRKNTFDERNHQKRQLLTDNLMTPHIVNFFTPSGVVMDIPNAKMIEKLRIDSMKVVALMEELTTKTVSMAALASADKLKEVQGKLDSCKASLLAEQERAFVAEQERETFRKKLEERERFWEELEKERESFRKELEKERESFRKELEKERETFREELKELESFRKKLEEQESSRKELEKEGESFRKELEERESFRKELEKELENLRNELEETRGKMVELEDENFELEMAADVAAWKEEKMVKEMETIRADTEDCKKKLLAASTDIEWLVRKGISSTIRQFLRSREFIEAHCKVNCACINYGVQNGCKVMRDVHVPYMPHSALPFYNPKARERVSTAFAEFVDTDFDLLTGLSDGRITLEDLRWLSNMEPTTV